MTVIFKHLTGWGDTSSPSSFGDELKAGVRRRLNGKGLMTEIPVPPLFHLGSLGAGPSPQGEQRRLPLKDKEKKKKKKGRETWVMDKPVVSVGEPRGEGAAVGAGM